ncbi:MAG TPA: hypothetical protein VKR21_05135 [Solirubrobacteraceae bacterium]|nr:hypothetical protein [Solirubrobacteraceae bacterium]
MASAATKTVGKAVVKRVAGSRPSGFASMMSAAIVGFAAAALTYRALRSGS